MSKQQTQRMIVARLSGLDDWLESEAPYVQHDQLHLEPNSVERAYWHLGYRAALHDALRLIRDCGPDKPDTPTSCSEDESGE